MSAEQIRDCIERDVAYVRKNQTKITTLANAHAHKNLFIDMLDVDRITIQPNFHCRAVTPSSKWIGSTALCHRSRDGDFERRVINDIANLDSVQWWHRNGSRGKGFRIKRLSEPLPDFIP